MTTANSNNDSSQTVACDLSVLTADEVKEVTSISRIIFSETQKVVETQKGFTFFFSKPTIELVNQIQRFVTLDSLCCPFMEHTVTVEPHWKNTLLKLQGDEKVRFFLKEELKRELTEEQFQNIVKV